MKKIYFIFIFSNVLLILFQFRATAQAPAKMSYQAVIRDENNNLVANSEIGIQISILNTSETGAVIYRETHQPVSNENGLITFEIGSGINRFGAIDSINWANGPFFLHTETDPTGGFNYTISGTSQLLSVPFAFHAKTADRISGVNPNTDTTAQFFEKELTDNENNIDCGFELASTSEIFINGIALPSGEWSGVGTQILNFKIQTKLFDKLKVKK